MELKMYKNNKVNKNTLNANKNNKKIPTLDQAKNESFSMILNTMENVSKYTELCKQTNTSNFDARHVCAYYIIYFLIEHTKYNNNMKKIDQNSISQCSTLLSSKGSVLITSGQNSKLQYNQKGNGINSNLFDGTKFSNIRKGEVSKIPYTDSNIIHFKTYNYFSGSLTKNRLHLFVKMCEDLLTAGIDAYNNPPKIISNEEQLRIMKKRRANAMAAEAARRREIMERTKNRMVR
jgi:hypothetical protein